MTSAPAPRYFENKLQLSSFDDANLTATLRKLQQGISRGLELIETHYPGPQVDERQYRIFVGDSGIALMYMRLSIQAKALGLPPKIETTLESKLLSHLPKWLTYARQPENGWLSPLDTHLGPALLIILHELHHPSTFDDSIWNAALDMLKKAVEIATTDEQIGGEEPMYGRSGVLWGALNLLQCTQSGLGDASRRKIVEDIVNLTTIEKIVEKNIKVGEMGAKIHAERHGGEGPPLVWLWFDKPWIGGVHGAAGIITILLQSPPNILKPHLPAIIDTISAIVETASSDGHIPRTLPRTDLPDPQVQICHGSPGLLLLLATFRGRYPDQFLPEWEAIERKASQVLWEQGILRKGLSVCHGITGNAWPWLIRGHLERDSPEGQQDLARALSFMAHSTDLPPLNESPAQPYETLGSPWSLFSGLAGAICAWADSCAVIEARLKREEVPVLGIMGLGGLGPHGLF